MTKVSVIIPVYNGMPYIRQCLESIMAQTLDDFDVVVINDGSTDRTAEVLQEFEDAYSNIHVYTQSNKGLYETRKIGLSLADGEYVGWVDADDFVKEDMFEKLYDAAVMNDSELTYCDYTFYPQKPATKEKWFRPYKGKRDVDFVERNSQPWNKLVKRDLLTRLHVGELFPSCFDEVYIRVLIHARNPVSVNESLYFYRFKEGSMSASYRNVEHYVKFIEASRNLKKNLNQESEYWEEYFNYRIIYYTLMAMLVAGHAGDPQAYHDLKQSLEAMNFKKNKHLDHILHVNFSRLKAFAIKNCIDINYPTCRLLSSVAFKGK